MNNRQSVGILLSIFSVAAFSAVGAVSASSPGEIAVEEAHTKGISVIPGKGNVDISLDRPDALYKCGEEAVFTITVMDTNGVKATSGKVLCRIDNYGAHVFSERKVDLASENPFVVKGTLPYPGFLRATVLGERGRQLRQYSAAYEPEKIRTAVPRPDDFDAFWDAAVARLEKEVPLDPRVERLPSLSHDGLEISSVSFATFGGRVYGALVAPSDPSGGPYPVVVHCPGAGTGFMLKRCRGEKGKICLYMSVHGFPLQDTDAKTEELYRRQEEKYRAIHGPARARAYPVGGLTVSREAAHYFPVVLGINRAVDWLARRPDVDRKRFVYRGASQGGGFGLYLCGLNKNFTRGFIGVPALTDLLGHRADGRQSGWPRIFEYETQKDAGRLARIEDNARYFDAAYFAARISIPVRVSVGYADESCAPHAVFAAYNAIRSRDKRIYRGIGGVHSSQNAPRGEIEKFLSE